MLCKTEDELGHLHLTYDRLDKEYSRIWKRIDEIDEEQDKLTDKMKKICPHVFKHLKKFDGKPFVHCQICHIFLDCVFEGHNEKLRSKMEDRFQKITMDEFVRTRTESNDDEQGKE